MSTAYADTDDTAIDEKPKSSRRGGARPYIETLKKRLGRSMQWSRRQLLNFREQRLNFVKAYVGAHYGDQSSSERMPVNWMEMVVDTYSQHLAANHPRYLISTKQQSLKATALDLETSVNYTTIRLDLRRVLKRCVKDALFLVSVAKVGICSNRGGSDDDCGKLYVCRVSPDDWVHDTFGREYEECWFSGNHYIQRLEDVRNNPAFFADVRKKVQAAPRTNFNEQGDTKTSTLGPGLSDMQDADLYDSAPLWDIWLPQESREGLICTVTANNHYGVVEDSQVLRVNEWEGPEEGPYLMLGYFSVPDNVMPLSLAALTFDNNHSYNRIFRKVIEQAIRQRTILPYKGVGEEDAQRIDKTADGGAVKVDGELPREVTLGGPHQLNQALLMQLDKWISHQTGNIDLLMGSEAQSPTARQDEMLQQNSSVRVGEMSDVTMDFASRIGRQLTWYTMSDPSLNQRLVHDLGGGVHIPFTLTPERLYGGETPSIEELRSQYLDLNFEVRAESMQPKNSAQKLASMMKFLQAIGPLMPFFQQQGSQLNAQNIARLFAKYDNNDDLDTLMQFAGPDQSNTQQPGPVGTPPPAKAPGPAPTGQAPRRNTGTAGGQQSAMLQQMLGRGANDAA
jgi:hypothetical protein